MPPPPEKVASRFDSTLFPRRAHQQNNNCWWAPRRKRLSFLCLPSLRRLTLDLRPGNKVGVLARDHRLLFKPPNKVDGLARPHRLFAQKLQKQIGRPLFCCLQVAGSEEIGAVFLRFARRPQGVTAQQKNSAKNAQKKSCASSPRDSAARRRCRLRS